MRQRSLVLIALACLFLIVSSAIAENWAVIVGINRYYKIRPELKYCVSDAKLFQETLIKYAGFKPDHIKVLFDEDATKANIQDALINWLARNVKPGDKAMFYFSGHGVTIRDGNGDEEDHYDESLVAYDSWLIDTKFILDDELDRWLDRIPTTDKVVVLDCCHSGTGIRALDPDVSVREYYPEDPIQVTQSRAAEPPLPQFEETTLMSACDANQVALESRKLGHGVFTYHLSQALNGEADADGDGRLSIEEVTNYTVGRIKSDGWEQDPQLEGNYKGKFLIGEGEVVQPYGVITAIENGNIYTLALGQKDEVTVGSLYAVFPAEATDTEGVGKGLIEITEVGADTSKARTFQVQGSVQIGDKVVEYRHRFWFENLRLRLAPIELGDNVAQTRKIDIQQAFLKQFRQTEHVEVVTEETEAADRRLQVHLARKPEEDTYRLDVQLINSLTQAKGQEYVVHFHWDTLDQAVQTLLNAQHLGGELEGAYALKRLSKLTNPPQAPVKIQLSVNKGANATYNIGDELTITATADRDCWLTLLDIGSSGTITVLFPNRYQKDSKISAGQPIQIPAPGSGYKIQVGGPPGTETIKAIATLDPLDLEDLSVADLQQRFKFFDAQESSQLTQKITGKDLFLVETDRWAENSIHFRIAPEELYKPRSVLELSILE